MEYVELEPNASNVHLEIEQKIALTLGQFYFVNVTFNMDERVSYFLEETFSDNKIEIA